MGWTARGAFGERRRAPFPPTIWRYVEVLSPNLSAELPLTDPLLDPLPKELRFQTIERQSESFRTKLNARGAEVPPGGFANTHASSTMSAPSILGDRYGAGSLSLTGTLRPSNLRSRLAKEGN